MVRFGVYSGDPFLAERQLRRRLGELGPASRAVLFADEVPPERILLEVGSADLFAAGKAVVVRRADALRGERELAEALRRGLPPGVAVFFLGEDLRGPLFQAAEEAQHFPRPTGKALRELAAELLREHGLPAHPFLVDLLVEAAADPLHLHQEVQKFALWKGGRLPRARLGELLFFSQPQPYGFLDAVGSGDRRQALAVLARLLRARWDPQALFHLVVNHVRQLLWALSAAESGEEPPGPEWLAQRRLAQARRHGQARLVQALALLQELDLKVKLGELDFPGALEAFILQWPPG
ncbi:MAG: hypothetical protein N2507_04690 [Candidatus Bipolaricaulota bacterium]|nr:hypothetical protein [Candidatus Bipolaricaulota bacterium]MCX7844613.1 hypothetical protein [Candidatus Bipolaricaulota bacterium]MDW8152120.1 hypothetical protein [Candidatus Bipolaricaulota bacterium]